MMSKAKPTPGPWHIEEDELYGIWAGEEEIAEVWAERNARFIVQACNAHDELLEAAKEMVRQWREAYYNNLIEQMPMVVKDLENTIAKAEGH